MPNIKSAIKRVRTTETARLRNHSLKSAYRTKIKQVEASFARPEQLPQLMRDAVSAIDRAAKAGAIHKNAADRHKSRLARRVATASAAEQVTKKPAAKAKAATAEPTPEKKS